MKATFTRLLCQAAYQTGALRTALDLCEPRSTPRPDARFQILTYHRVGRVYDPFVPALPVEVFERHVRHLHDYYRVLSLSELWTAVQRREIPPRAVVITFDDGYEDTYLHAYPVLRRYDLPAIIFLTTGLLDTDVPMWNDCIGTAIRDTHRDALDAVPECDAMSLTTPAQRLHALERTLTALKPYAPADRLEWTRRVSEALGVPLARQPRMLRWEQIEEMHTNGIELGAHTVHHPILTSISADAAQEEIVKSKQAIEARLQTRVDHFAYPNGTPDDFNEATKQFVRQAGFATAASTVCGTNSADADPYALRRGGPWESDTSVFAAKLWWYRMARG